MKLVDRNPAANLGYARGLARAFAGAIIFGLPLLMTMEMWSMGFHLDRGRLLLFVVLNMAILIGLSRVSGFEPTVNWADDILDAFSAYGVGALSSLAVLVLFGVIGPGMGAAEIAGKVAIQSVPASFGAMIASKQLGSNDGTDEQPDRSSYIGELFMMVAGALFLAFNVAPTEEIALISFKMTPWHGLVLVLLSILLLHAFVYGVGFKGQEERGEGVGPVSVLARFTIPGYGIAVLVSLYVLWTFGRMEGTGLAQIASMVAVLAFPSAVGAAIARLVL